MASQTMNAGEQYTLVNALNLAARSCEEKAEEVIEKATERVHSADTRGEFELLTPGESFIVQELRRSAENYRSMRDRVENADEITTRVFPKNED